MGIGRLGTAMYLVDAQGRDRRRVRAGLRRHRPADHRRPGGVAAGRRLDRRRARAPIRGARHRGAAARPELAKRVSQIDVVEPARRGRDSRRRHGAAAARRHRLRGAAAAIPRSRAGAARARRGDRLRGLAVRRTVVRAPGRRRAAQRRRSKATGGIVARHERYVVGLDIGTSKVCTVVGELLDDGGVDVIGLGVAESKGLKRGVVVNLEAAVESIKKSIEEAELMAGVEVGSVHLAISGPHIKGFNSRGVVAVAGKNREVTRDDVRRAIDAARAVSLPAGREILHVLPQDFVVDEQEGIGAPVGLTGARLEVNVHIITGSQTATQNLVACVNRAGVEVHGHGDRPAGGVGDGADAGREGARRRGRRHRRRHRRPRDLRARQPVAHRGDRRRRRSLHQRHRRRPAHADSRRGEDQAPRRLRAVVDGRGRRDHRSGQRRRPAAARDGAAHPVATSCSRAPRRCST